MWRIWLSIGLLAWTLTIFASGAMNFMSGYSFGRDASEAAVLALLGVAADGWKSIGPILIVGLYRNRRYVISIAGALVWIACFSVAVTAAVGMIGQTRSSIVAERDALREKYVSRDAKLKELLARRDANASARSSQEIDAQIDVLLAQPVVVAKRYRGTIDTISNGCMNVISTVATACEQVAKLRSDKAASLAREQLSKSIDDIRDELEVLTQKGAGAGIDPQGDLVVILTAGLVARSDVQLALVLMIVVMVELLSAFAPMVLSEFAAMRQAKQTASEDAAGRDRPRASTDNTEESIGSARELMFEYLADRVRPSAAGRVARELVWNDYVLWCVNADHEIRSRREFFLQLDEIFETDLRDHIKRVGDEYVGCALVATPSQDAGPTSPRLSAQLEAD